MKHALFSVACLAACLPACKSSHKPADKTAEPTKSAEPTKPAEPVAPTKPPLPTVDATKFDRKCKLATDCVIAKAAACDPCACPTEAIASSELAKFDEVAAALHCEPNLDFKCTTPCPTQRAACTDGNCAIAP